MTVDTGMGVELEFLTDPGAFLAAAGEHLDGDPVLATVVTTMADRSRTALREGRTPPADDWWLVVRLAGQVVGAAMRTAPFAPRPAYVLPMPDEAARLLAQQLHERGEELLGINGALPTALACAQETARLTGRTVRIDVHQRLFELHELIAPRPVPGRLRVATAADLDLVVEWHGAFMGAADEQAGRPPGASAHEAPPADELARRIDRGQEWLWVDADGTVVHLTAVNPPSLGVARIGPVYTPPDQRGRGWASAAVAAVSQRVLDAGDRVCLFTDQANPTSNAIYQALGYQPVADTAFVSLR